MDHSLEDKDITGNIIYYCINIAIGMKMTIKQ